MRLTDDPESISYGYPHTGVINLQKKKKKKKTQPLPSIAIHSMWNVLLEGGYPQRCVHMFEGCMLVLLVLWQASRAC